MRPLRIRRAAGGIVHRDLKPSNVCVSLEDVSAPVIIDFGTALLPGREDRFMGAFGDANRHVFWRVRLRLQLTTHAARRACLACRRRDDALLFAGDLQGHYVCRPAAKAPVGGRCVDVQAASCCPAVN